MSADLARLRRLAALARVTLGCMPAADCADCPVPSPQCLAYGTLLALIEAIEAELPGPGMPAPPPWGGQAADLETWGTACEMPDRDGLQTSPDAAGPPFPPRAASPPHGGAVGGPAAYLPRPTEPHGPGGWLLDARDPAADDAGDPLDSWPHPLPAPHPPGCPCPGCRPPGPDPDDPGPYEMRSAPIPPAGIGCSPEMKRKLLHSVPSPSHQGNGERPRGAE